VITVLEGNYSTKIHYPKEAEDRKLQQILQEEPWTKY
jgi:hypothetical protein